MLSNQIKFFKERAIYQTTDSPIVAFIYGEAGYYPIYTALKAEALNDKDISIEILESAEMGSMIGWDKPGAAIAKQYADNKLSELASIKTKEIIVTPKGGFLEVDSDAYILLVESLEMEGMTRSDAQGVADVEFLKEAGFIAG